jgi:predicted RNase H-like nuclease (RuvC/YqgF family)
MNIQTVKENYNRGRMDLKEIKWLIDTVEHQENEYITLSQSISEDDGIIEQLQEELKQYKLQEALLLGRIKKIEQCSRFKNYLKTVEENLKIYQELAELKAVKS